MITINYLVSQPWVVVHPTHAMDYSHQTCLDTSWFRFSRALSINFVFSLSFRYVQSILINSSQHYPFWSCGWISDDGFAEQFFSKLYVATARRCFYWLWYLLFELSEQNAVVALWAWILFKMYFTGMQEFHISRRACMLQNSKKMDTDLACGIKTCLCQILWLKLPRSIPELEQRR